MNIKPSRLIANMFKSGKLVMKVFILVLLGLLWSILFFFAMIELNSHWPWLVINIILWIINIIFSAVFSFSNYAKKWLFLAILVYGTYLLLFTFLPQPCGSISKSVGNLYSCDCVGITVYQNLGFINKCIGVRTHCYKSVVDSNKNIPGKFYADKIEIPCTRFTLSKNFF